MEVEDQDQEIDEEEMKVDLPRLKELLKDKQKDLEAKEK